MTFKEFDEWCNERACDGCWGMVTALVCIDILENVKKVPFWKRRKYWESEYEKRVLDEIVNPIEKKIEELKTTNVEGNNG
jgi:hypothetical protein